MREMKSSLKTLVVVGALFAGVLIYGQQKVFAIPGQLNYDLPTTQEQPSTTLVITDTQALDACNKKNTQLNSSLQNCQTSGELLKKADDKTRAEANQYRIFALISSTLAIIFGSVLAVVLLKKKKDVLQPAPPPPLN